MRRTHLLALPLLVGSALSSCGGESPIEPGPDTGPVTAFIDGEPFVAESAMVTRSQTGVVVTAVAGERSIRFEFTDRGTSNYVIGPGNPVAAEATIGTSTWRAGGSEGSGTITVAEFIPGFMSGSFELTLVGGPGQTTLDVTNGRFVIIG